MKSLFLITMALATSLVAGTAQTSHSTFRLPPHRKAQLKNGLTLLLLEKHELPLVSMAFCLRAGGTSDPAGKEGLASLTADLLRKGTAKRTADDISSELDFMGATLSFSAGSDATVGHAEFMKKDLAGALDLIADILRAPAFPAIEVTKLLQQNIDGFKQEKDEPGSIIRKYFNAYLYGNHLYARPTDGDENTLAGLDRDDIVKFYRSHYAPQSMTIAVAGDFKAEEMLQELSARFESWESTSPASAPVLPAPSPVKGRKLLLVDKPDATQTYFQIGNIGIAATNRDRVAISLVNTIFGGRFTSQLNDALRVESGYTYGARSSFEQRQESGPFVISSFTANATTLPAIDLALDVLKKLHTNGVTEEQIASAKAYLKGQFPPKVETIDQLAATLVRLNLYGLGTDEVDEYFKRVDQVTRQETERIIHEYYPLENLAFVLVGKAAEIRSAVSKYAPQIDIRDINQKGYR